MKIVNFGKSKQYFLVWIFLALLPTINVIELCNIFILKKLKNAPKNVRLNRFVFNSFLVRFGSFWFVLVRFFVSSYFFLWHSGRKQMFKNKKFENIFFLHLILRKYISKKTNQNDEQSYNSSLFNFGIFSFFFEVVSKSARADITRIIYWLSK